MNLTVSECDDGNDLTTNPSIRDTEVVVKVVVTIVFVQIDGETTKIKMEIKKVENVTLTHPLRRRRCTTRVLLPPRGDDDAVVVHECLGGIECCSFIPTSRPRLLSIVS